MRVRWSLIYMTYDLCCCDLAGAGKGRVDGGDMEGRMVVAGGWQH